MPCVRIETDIVLWQPTVYGSYLVFQLFSHKALYDEKHEDVFRSTQYPGREKKKAMANGETNSQAEANGSSIPLNPVSSREPFQSSPTGSISQEHDAEAATVAPPQEEEEVEVPQMSVPMTIGLLVVVTVVSFVQDSCHILCVLQSPLRPDVVDKH